MLQELVALGCELRYHESTSQEPQARGKVVSIPYAVPCGSQHGTTVRLGWNVVGSDGPYPEHPPHWIHVHPACAELEAYVREGGAAHGRYADAEGREWLYVSFMPTGIWEHLDPGTMHDYIRQHLPTLWEC